MSADFDSRTCMDTGTAAPTKRVTIVDVAQAAGVSAGTVSNTLSGKRRVDAETRKRIEQAIQDLGYRPNLAARRMRMGQTNTIAIVSSMPAAVSAGPSKLGFLMEIAASVAATAMEQNTALILVPPIKDPVTALTSMAMDGAIVVEPDENDPTLDYLTKTGVPTICIGKPVGAPAVFINLDYTAMAEMLIAHLFEVGATRFPLIVGASARPSNLTFKDVYRKKCAEAGIEGLILEVPEDNAERGAAGAISRLIASGHDLDGVLVPIDAMATGVMRALRDGGLSVPEQVRVVTRYNGFRAQTETPALTAVDLKLESVAVLATNTLLGIIAGTNRESCISSPAPTLIVRPSSQRP